eukprot:TRINITY_DN4069_c0_g1_i1.p1 TRINITY_DN4069_c0_g1~~TRINITY_DN4069_c0_g1_i1.p1  ORF type:complete len:247 (-),score=74.22 TRINITY_DN4069_c0_g1_i1:223-963(-)
MFLDSHFALVGSQNRVGNVNMDFPAKTSRYKNLNFELAQNLNNTHLRPQPAMALASFPLREITNVSVETNRIFAKKNPFISRWTGTHVRLDREDVDSSEEIVTTEEHGEKEQTKLYSPFSFSAPPLVKQPEEASFSAPLYEFEEFEDENDENVDPLHPISYREEAYEGGKTTDEEEEGEGCEGEEVEEKFDLWAQRETLKKVEWCGTRIFFSSSSEDEGVETEEEETDDEQMRDIENDFARFVTAD